MTPETMYRLGERLEADAKITPRGKERKALMGAAVALISGAADILEEGNQRKRAELARNPRRELSEAPILPKNY